MLYEKNNVVVKKIFLLLRGYEKFGFINYFSTKHDLMVKLVNGEFLSIIKNNLKK